MLVLPEKTLAALVDQMRHGAAVNRIEEAKKIGVEKPKKREHIQTSFSLLSSSMTQNHRVSCCYRRYSVCDFLQIQESKKREAGNEMQGKATKRITRQK